MKTKILMKIILLAIENWFDDEILIELLNEPNIDINWNENECGYTPLMCAIVCNNTKAIQCIIGKFKVNIP